MAVQALKSPVLQNISSTVPAAPSPVPIATRSTPKPQPKIRHTSKGALIDSSSVPDSTSSPDIGSSNKSIPSASRTPPQSPGAIRSIKASDELVVSQSYRYPTKMAADRDIDYRTVSLKAASASPRTHTPVNASQLAESSVSEHMPASSSRTLFDFLFKPKHEVTFCNRQIINNFLFVAESNDDSL